MLAGLGGSAPPEPVGGGDDLLAGIGSVGGGDDLLAGIGNAGNVAPPFETHQSLGLLQIQTEDYHL